MYWRILAVIVLLVFASYFLGKRQHSAAKLALNTSSIASTENKNEEVAVAADEQQGDISFAPIGMQSLSPTVAPEPTPKVSANQQPISEERFTLDIREESQRIASMADVAIGAIQVSDRLPQNAIMAMTFRRGACALLVNNALPLDGLLLVNLSAYGRRQLTYTLGHEIGHCYVMTMVAKRDPAILTSLSPPGKGYSFEQYVGMSGKYNEYPDLNRWNEEWADTFSAFILSRVYGKEFAMAVANERFSLRKDQEKNGNVLMSNVYGGHGSLAEDALFTIQSPLEIANLVKLGRLNTSR